MSAVAVENTPEAWTARSAAPAPWDAVLWSREAQEVRFGVVSRALMPRDGEVLLDYGCGTGRFSEWLSPLVYYVGFDWADGMRERARLDHPYALIVDDLGDAEYDLVTAIGPFNLPGGWSKGHTYCKVSDLWRRCRRTMAVSLYAGMDKACLAYTLGDLASMAVACLKVHGGDSFEIKRGYLRNDLLLVLRR